MKPTVIAVQPNGQAEIYVPIHPDWAHQKEEIKQKFPESSVTKESNRFLTVTFKSVRFASMASRQLK